VISQRKAFLAKHDLSIERTTRVAFTYTNEDDPYDRYRVLDDSITGTGMTDSVVHPADALVTTEPGKTLFLPVADCIGAVLYDPEHQVLMVSHFGRHSLENKGAVTSVAFLTKHYNSEPGKLRVWMTAAAGKDNYPIWKLGNRGMKEVAFEQLATAGVLFDNIIDDPADTTLDHNYYSYSEFLKGNREVDGDHAIVAVMQA
jgi:copper oxidase (laccase) domain-containing protein